MPTVPLLRYFFFSLLHNNIFLLPTPTPASHTRPINCAQEGWRITFQNLLSVYFAYT